MYLREIKRCILSATMMWCMWMPSASAQHGQYVGGDISLLPQYETLSSGYLDGNGKKIDDLLTWFKDECGWNTFRVRLFSDPTKSTDPAVVQDKEYVKALGKRIKDAGCKFVLDLHYSDTWADAGNHKAPASWSDCANVQEKADRLASYTRGVLNEMKAAGAEPDLVQVGNEIMYGMAGVNVAPYDKSGNDWDGFIKLVDAGCKAVRSTCPAAKIIIHTDRPCNVAYNKYFYDKLSAVDYDIIGLSYYPFWHGALNDLLFAINRLKTDFPTKKVQIVETAYNFQSWPTSGINYDTQSTWACSPDGQYKFVKDLIAGLKDKDNVDGLYYWFPEEAGNGDYVNWDTKEGLILAPWLNRGMWWESQTTSGHWPVKATEGMVHYLFRDFLGAQTSITAVNTDESTNEGAYYNLSGQRVGSTEQNLPQGIYIKNNKKIIIK